MTMVGRVMAAAIAAATFVAAWSNDISAQQRASDQQLTGSWQLSEDKAGDGFGDDANGMLIFSGKNFALQIVNGDITPLPSDDRRSATPAQNQTMGKGSVAFFGTYDGGSAGHSIVLHIARSSFPNWDGTDQKWTIRLAADTLTLVDTSDSAVTLVWERVSPLADTTRGGRRVSHYD